MKQRDLISSLIIMLLALSGTVPAAAQSHEDESFFRNAGILAGYTYARPNYPALEDFRARFNSETAFGHNEMKLDPYAGGVGAGIGFYIARFHLGLTYGATAQKGTYSMRPSPPEDLQEYSLKMAMRSFRVTLAYGVSWGKYGTCGLYGGAAIYGGNWIMKVKRTGGGKYQGVNADDFDGYAFGISPQVALRLYFIELKAFYDVPAFNTNTGQLYNELFKDNGISKVPDGAMRSRMNAFGVTASVFIPLGKPSPRAAGDDKGKSGSDDRFWQDQKRINDAAEQNRRQLQENERRIQEEERSNQRRHERERRGY